MILPMDELIRELEELAEFASDALRDEGRTDAIRMSYAHAARLARAAKVVSSGMKPAAEYAELAERAVAAGARAAREGGRVDIWVGEMVALSNLSIAAATLEAARLMGPTPEDQARLDALTKLSGMSWASCVHCDQPIFRHVSWSHEGGTPPQDHDAEPLEPA